MRWRLLASRLTFLLVTVYAAFCAGRGYEQHFHQACAGTALDIAGLLSWLPLGLLAAMLLANDLVLASRSDRPSWLRPWMIRKPGRGADGERQADPLVAHRKEPFFQDAAVKR